MPTLVKIPYDEAEKLMEEGDILLFRSTGIISALIKMAGQGAYSHAAITAKNNGYTSCIEFREWFSSREINLKNYFLDCKRKKTEIDIYRPIPIFGKLKFDFATQKIIYKEIKFNGKLVTNCMKKLTGLPYSYKRIWLLLKIKLFKWKILKNIEKITNDLPTDELIMPVCSTVIAHCFSVYGFDILYNKSDEYTEPSYIALSTRLCYLFTLD